MANFYWFSFQKILYRALFSNWGEAGKSLQTKIKIYGKKFASNITVSGWVEVWKSLQTKILKKILCKKHHVNIWLVTIHFQDEVKSLPTKMLEKTIMKKKYHVKIWLVTIHFQDEVTSLQTKIQGKLLCKKYHVKYGWLQ